MGKFVFGVAASGVACLFLLASAASGGDEEKKAYRNVTPEKIEELLKGMDIKFKKSPGKTDGVHFYDFERNKFKIRLHNYNGKDLWIDALFTDKAGLEDVNAWNRRARFSRAVLIKNPERETVSLESQIDCLGGVTDAIIKQFVVRFDNEIAEFVKFLVK